MMIIKRPILFFFLIFLWVFVYIYVPLPPLRGQHTVLCHPRWLPTSGLTEFAVCWGGAGFEPRTTDLSVETNTYIKIRLDAVKDVKRIDI